MTDRTPATAGSGREWWTLALAEVSILGLTVLGWVLSYSALRRLAEAHGYAGWEANLWPLTVDLLAIASAMIAITLAGRGHGPTGEAWVMAVLAAAATLAGNVLSARGDLVAMVLHAWPAICMLGAWHLFFRSVEAKAPAPDGQGGHPLAVVAAKVAELREAGRAVTGDALAPELGISPRTARRRLRQLEGGNGL